MRDVEAWQFQTQLNNVKLSIMTGPRPSHCNETEPPRKGGRRSYDEGVDEPGKLIGDEPVEVEKETPQEENEPVERPPPENTPRPPAFEDDEPSG